ncbi:hypothetical protein Tco_0547825 [Tanacetum coccineum]
MVFHKMDTEEVSDRFLALCFVNGLEAYNGEISLRVEENMISNEYAVKLCLEHEVKRGNKIVKKELIVALRGKLYFVKFIINQDEDDVEPGSMDDWHQLLDFNLDDIPLLGGEELLPFVCKMGKSSRNKKKAMENLNLFYQDIGTSSSTGRNLIQEEASKEALALIINTGLDINTMPYRIYEKLGREEMKKVDRGITMINHTQAEDMGILTNVLCRVGVTTLISKFLILDIPIDRDAPIVVGRGFMRTISGITMGGYDAEVESSRSKRFRQFKTMEEVLLPQVHHEFLLWDSFNNDVKSMYNTKLANLLPRHVYSPCVVNWDILNGMGCDGEIDDMLWIKLREAESNEEIFTSMAWIRSFNIKEPIYAELFHEFYSTYEFDEFARRLGLYHANELEEDGFDVYFQGGLRSDDNFNAQEPPRASMHDLYDRMGSMEIRQEAIERMEYKQSYHWDRYQGVFKHMYPRLPLQYQQQQQQDDDE